MKIVRIEDTAVIAELTVHDLLCIHGALVEVLHGKDAEEFEIRFNVSRGAAETLEAEVNQALGKSR